MSALTESDRITLTEARTLANADGRAALIDALAVCESPTLATLGPDMEQSTAYAAALGCAQGLLTELAAKVEGLAAQLDAQDRPAPVWAVWRVDEGTGMAREVGHLGREQAEAMAAQLNQDRKRPIHFMALPLGGEPFDTADERRNPWHLAQATIVDLIGREVISIHTDGPARPVGVISRLDPADADFVWVTWTPTDATLPAVEIREALDELTPAGVRS